MINTVVLDLGNVMVSFYPDLYIAQFVHRKGEIDYFNHICFRSTEWKAGDYGTMTRGEIIEAICAKYPADAGMIHTIMDNCDEMLRVSEKNARLVQRLQEAGIGVYFLSNTNESAYAYMREHYAFFRQMDGGIASYQDGVVKPGQEIFALFLERYGKKAEECVFVDDTPVNVEAAIKAGYTGVILKNMEDLETELCRFPELSVILRGEA